jgi:murein DD-endopeptidase MepM/ murein hydrolase activator NlpD
VRGGGVLAAACLALFASTVPPASASSVKVSWQPSRPDVSGVALLVVHGPPDGSSVEGSIGGRPVSFFRDAGGYAALVGFDMELAAGRRPWRVEIREPGRPPRSLSGVVPVGGREFPVQRLTLPTPMVDLDPDTERRAVSETETLRRLYRTVTPERLWRGSFVRPIAGDEAGSGFGSRRIINGQARSPHGGTDYAVPRGTPVMAVNGGRVALVGDYFFPGRLVVVDHGLGLYTLYFHLDEARVEIGQRVVRGQLLGTVGSTGRATGPHLHFGAQVGPARVDPERLLALPLTD